MTTKNKHLRSNYDSAGCPPGWAWLLAGIIIGIFISFLIYLREFAPHSLPPEHTRVAPIAVPVSASTEKEPISPTDKPSNKFDFYDILPGHEIKIPAKDSIDEEEPLEVTVEGKYLLQVGLFRDKQAAEGLRDYLYSLGMPTKVVQAPFSSTEYGYRVQVGPFSNLEKLNRTRSLLTANNISSILLKYSGSDAEDEEAELMRKMLETEPTEDDLVTDDSTEWNEEELEDEIDKELKINEELNDELEDEMDETN
ncbi:SPOR domain-containing protein [Candidatus Halobeggiatoa sp. HSG11]|nr:SPOR domain-containing protein [Candidatus Halobeggiatoa sp. HSG11]